MERKTKYQYSYFIQAYTVNETKYNQYMLKLLKNEKCSLENFEREKDLNLYTYFKPELRNYLFWQFKYEKEQIKKFEELDVGLKASFLEKQPCAIFEYKIGREENAKGKIGEENGIFFDIPKIQIVCFRTGVCFVVFKTIIDSDNITLQDIQNFNYKFRDINSEYATLKKYDNIKIQTNAFQNMQMLSTIIKEIVGNNIQERFYTYTYACLEQEIWNDNVNFETIETDFTKLVNVLPANAQLNQIETENLYTLPKYKYVKIGTTKQAVALLTSSINIANYTKISEIYEKEYLYTYILQLSKKIYLQKIKQELKTNFRKAQKSFFKFTEEVWEHEITSEEEGSALAILWKENLELIELYEQVKNYYEIRMKKYNSDKTWIIGYSLIGLVVLLIVIKLLC